MAVGTSSGQDIFGTGTDPYKGPNSFWDIWHPRGLLPRKYQMAAVTFGGQGEP